MKYQTPDWKLYTSISKSTGRASQAWIDSKLTCSNIFRLFNAFPTFLEASKHEPHSISINMHYKRSKLHSSNQKNSSNVCICGTRIKNYVSPASMGRRSNRASTWSPKKSSIAKQNAVFMFIFVACNGNKELKMIWCSEREIRKR